MSIGYSTGETRDMPCSACGVTVQHARVGVLPATVNEWWDPRAHAAPCGKPCIGGGVHPRDYKAGNVHKRDCAECAAEILDCR